MESQTSPQTLPGPTPPVKITLADGKERVLRYSLGVTKKLRDQYAPGIFDTGKNLQEFLSDSQRTDEVKLVDLLWHGLTHSLHGGDPQLTREQISDLLDANNIVYVFGQLIKALFPPQQPKNEAAPAPTPASPEIPKPAVQ